MSDRPRQAAVAADLAELLARNLTVTQQAVQSLGAAAASLDQMPGAATTRAVLDVERRWRNLEAEFGLLDAIEMGNRARSRSPRGWASHNRKAGHILGVQRRNRYVFPGFQLDPAGHIRDAVPQAAAVLRSHGWSDEHIVLWFMAGNGWLAGARPVDRLDDDEAVTTAAVRATDQW